MTAKTNSPHGSETYGKINSDDPRKILAAARTFRGSTRSTSQPANVVPMKLAPPMMPSAAAAVTWGMPLSIACGIRCVPMRPLEVTPQTKKQALRSQKLDVRKTSDIDEAETGRKSRL